MNILIDNNKLTKIVNEIGEEFNCIDFLIWYESINKNYKFNEKIEFRKEQIKNYFDMENKHIKIKNLPVLEINTEEKFIKFISFRSSCYKKPIINMLKNDFNINYWKEVLNYSNKKENIFEISLYYELMSHCMNNQTFTKNNIKEIKVFTENLINRINDNKNQKFTEIIQFMSYTIENKDLFGNEWIIVNLNNIIKPKKDGSLKKFNFHLNNIINKLNMLDFININIDIDNEFKKILNGKFSLRKTPIKCYPYFFEINFLNYAIEKKINKSLLQTNCICGFEYINKFLNKDINVLSSFAKRESNIMSLTVLHGNEKLNKKLDFLFNFIINTKDKSLTNCDLEKVISFFELNDNINININNNNNNNINKIKI